MTIGAGILIAAVGAVLRFAVTADVEWVDVQAVGTIMIIAGLAIALIALIATLSSRRPAVGYRRTAVVAPTAQPVVQQPVVAQPVVAPPVVQQPVVQQPVVQQDVVPGRVIVDDPGNSATI